MKSIIINGKEFGFSCTDIDFLKVFSGAEQKMLESIANSDTGGSALEILENQFCMMETFFRDVFGDAAETIFDGRRDIAECLAAYELMGNTMVSQMQEATAAVQRILGNGAAD
jgi:hypothetical protein